MKKTEFIYKEQGIAMVEYALIAALVAAVGATGLTFLGVELAALFTRLEAVVLGS